MKYQIACIFLFLFCLISNNSYAQEKNQSSEPKPVTKLFRSQETLPLKLSFSNKEIKKKTNDSTYKIQLYPMLTKMGYGRNWTSSLELGGYLD